MKAVLPRPVKLWSIPREWSGETCFVVGGGTSVKGLDPEQLRGRRVIVINRGFRHFPFADVLYFCDTNWWRVDGNEVLEKFTGKYIVSVSRIIHPRVKNIKNTGTAGLELAPTGVKHGTNSGYQAIGVAYHLGVKRIVLVGYDMTTANGETHFHGGYGMGADQMAHILKSRMLPFFSRLISPLAEAGVEVYNANPDSALDCWPKIPLDEALKMQ